MMSSRAPLVPGGPGASRFVYDASTAPAATGQG